MNRPFTIVWKGSSQAVRIIFLIFIGLGFSQAQAQLAYFDGTKLVLPVVIAQDIGVLSGDLTLVPGTFPYEFEVTRADPTENTEQNGASTYQNGVLLVPSALVAGEIFWGRFDLIGNNPIRFRLGISDLDDDDDDNDGIPDAEDSAPYEPDFIDDTGIAGIWTFRFQIDDPDSLDGTWCDEDPVVTFEQAVITFLDNSTYHVQSVYYDGPATVTDNVFSYQATYDEDEGETTRNLMMTIESADSMSGGEIWSWISPEPEGAIKNCVNVQSIVTATRS